MNVASVGCIGLGNMGRVLATNVVGAGYDVVSHDLAGAERNAAGATFAADVTEVARRTDVVVLSLPDGEACQGVARAVAITSNRRVRCVIDTSTVGVTAAREIADMLAEGGVAYVDAPVSGGVAGARARTLLVMYAGTDAACEAAEPVLVALSDRRRRVGETPGMAQALKLANNFLSATALAATSEAIAFGLSVGLDMGTMLEVIDSSSGQSTATRDKFPTHVLTGTYAAGFANTLMAKDLALYLGAVAAQRTPATLGQVTESMWERFARSEPGADFTRIYPWVESAVQRSGESR